jgi:hypothetical protein
VDREVGDSVELLRAGVELVDLLLHDSSHTREHELAELGAVEKRLHGGPALSDNAHSSDALVEWAERTGRRFTFFREKPADHWFLGEGIGAARAQ